MNATLTRWIDALHKQELFSSDWLCVIENGTSTFCPLGVLCDISNLGRWVKVDKPMITGLTASDAAYPWTYIPTDIIDIDTKTLYGTTLLPKEVQQLVQFSTATGIFKVSEISAPTRTLLVSKLKRVPEFLSIVEISSLCTRLEIPIVIESILNTDPPSLHNPFPSHATTTE